MEYNRSARGIDIEAKAKYDEAERIAKGLCTQLLSLRRNGELDKELVSTTIRDIVLAKYYLSHEDAVSEYFNALGELSIAKSLGKSVSEVRGLDLEAKCNGTSSVMTKKILLMIFLQRELFVEISSEAASNILTISELADLIFSKLVSS